MSIIDVFISHASEDKPFAEKLRQALDAQGVQAWIDHRELTGGKDLNEEIQQAIDGAKAFLVVLTLQAFNSRWVGKELRRALGRMDREPGFKVIPLLLGSQLEPAAVENLAGRELLCVGVPDTPGGLQSAMGAILAALGRELPDWTPPVTLPPPPPVEELQLLFTQPRLETVDGDGKKARVVATLRVEYHPGHGGAVGKSGGMTFTAPLLVSEAKDLSWYLEQYPRWPGEPFRSQAQNLEARLPEWGKKLFDATLGQGQAQEVVRAWLGADDNHAYLLTVELEDEGGEGASALLGLPWELMHDGTGFLFQRRRATRVRRRVRVKSQPPIPAPSPLRVLFLSPRPEEKGVSYIDHRVTAQPLAEILADLGERAELTVLAEPTFPKLMEALREADDEEKPFHVVHFDGHGVYLPNQGLGALCFEKPGQRKKLVGRAMEVKTAQEMAAELKDYRIPLFFLEACQTAKAKQDPTASVAATLLRGGVASVAAMSHSVLVETARRFVTVFYKELADGERVGEAMRAAQHHLFNDKHRGFAVGAGEFDLHDWFVPVLFQEGGDAPLVAEIPAPSEKEVIRKGFQARLGHLPDAPPHGFVGRSRELLAIERLLLQERYAVLVGEGGEGKTAIANEAARWLTRIRWVERIAFISLEQKTHHDAVLDELGRQLVGEGYLVHTFPDRAAALQPLERELKRHPTLILLDNGETILPPREGGENRHHDPEELQRLLALFHAVGGMGQTKLLFTSREPLPAPFDLGRHRITIGDMDDDEAIQLLKQVLHKEGKALSEEKQPTSWEALRDLVHAVHGHARTLTLLGPELVNLGVNATRAQLHGLMQSLEAKYPDQRERSLYTGIKLSLQRLPAEVQDLIRPLGVFHGGGHVDIIGHVLGIEDLKQRRALAQLLQHTRLCEVDQDGYVTFPFALGPYLWGLLSAEEQQQAEERWLESQIQFAVILHQQLFQDTALAARLTQRDLPNLLAGLERTVSSWPPERVMNWAGPMATLVHNLGDPSAQGRVTKVRQALDQRLGAGWTHERFLLEANQVEHLAQQGRITEARQAAQSLLERCLAAGEGAYPDAPYDLAMAHLRAGRFARMSGGAREAVPLLEEARERFLRLGEGGDASARRMAAAALNDLGDAQQNLGQWEEAARCYEGSGEEQAKEGNHRGVAVSKGQLGTVRMLQGRHGDALKAYEEARKTFEKMNDHASVSTAWHQMGMVHEEMDHWEQAEVAYRESIRIVTALDHKEGVAATLGQLGNLYGKQPGKGEDAVKAYVQARDIFIQLGNRQKEGWTRSNLADTLREMGRLEEARTEIQQAIVCMEPFGHAATPWKSQDILADIETDLGNHDAALEARQKARALFAAYRRDGSKSYADGANWCRATATAIMQKQMDQTRQKFEEVAQQPNLPAWVKALIPVLLQILDGERDPALAHTPGLDYDDAVEVELLLEQLAQHEGQKKG